MKVIFMFNRWNVIGGGEITFASLINHLSQRKDLDVFVFIPSGGNGEKKVREIINLDEEKIFCFETPSFRGEKRKVFHAILQFRDLFKKIKPDIVHANGSRIALYSNLAKVKTKVIWHVRISQKDFLDLLLFPLSDGIIANSQKTKRERFRWFRFMEKSKKIRVIYNGFQIDKIREIANKTHTSKEKFGLSGTTIGGAGRLESGKGFEYMLTFLEIISKKEKISSIIAGEGPLKNFLKSMNKNLKAVFPGYMAIEDLLSVSDILCFPSVVDSFGNLVVESMIVGKPCLVSCLAGASEIYPIKELIFSPYSFSEFSKAFHYAKENLQNESLREILQKESENFSIEKKAGEVLEFYKEIISQKK